VGMSERVVRVWCGESNKVGSGYRVDTRHILTARHVVGDAQDCYVRLDGETEYRPTKVTWRGYDNVDIVVLALVGEPPPLADRDPIWAGCRWVDAECRAAGYPAFLDFADGAEREEFDGRLCPLAGIERGRIHASGSWAENRAPERWGGMSGAALFSGGYLIGVVTESMADRLLACPVSKLFEDETFRQTFPEFRFDDTVLWPVADQPAIRQLRPWTKRRTGMLERPPSELLLAHNEVVPFDNSLRVRELAWLEDFSVDRGPAMLVFTGPGGAGKTRLMIEWCSRMRERGWLAGFVESGHSDLSRVLEGETPRLLVVDYPEGRVSEVALLCRRAHAAVASVRLVLLARSKGPWFDEVRQEVDGGMVTSARWEELAAMDDAQRRRAYQRARIAFRGVVADQDEIRPDDLARDELPLFAHMRALLAAYGDRDIDETPEQTLARVLDHERKHWRGQLVRLLGSPPNKAMLWDLDRVLAAVVLFGGIDGPLGELLRWLRPGLSQREREAFATSIAALYRRGTRVMPLQPDLLGEQLVLEAISHAVEQDGAPAVEWWLSLPVDERAPKGSVGHSLVVLTRLVHRKVEVASGWLHAFVGPRCERWMQACVNQRDHADPRGYELAAAVRALGDVDLARQLEPTLPKATVELLQLRIEVANILLRHAPQDESVDSRHQRARLWSRLANYLADAGRLEEALPAIQLAVRQYLDLAKSMPEAFFPHLAATVNNLGICLSRMGQREQALDAAQAALEIRRQLAEAMTDASLIDDLASALNNLGLRLLKMGRRAEAVEATQEAVAHFREVVKAQPEALSNLAAALNNLGPMLSEMGRWEEALTATQEAVELYRELVKGGPDAFLPKLAMALNNLGPILNELGRQEGAREVTQEAVEHYRELVREKPVLFLPELASALNGLGRMLKGLGRREEGRTAMQEAVEHYRELVKTRPDIQPELARLLAVLGMTQSESGAHEESLVSLAEGVRVLLPHYRQLQSDHAPLFTLIIQLLQMTCEAGGLPVPADLRTWVEDAGEAQ
jgi:tetratricopeptide (TPR) repeat protein